MIGIYNDSFKDFLEDNLGEPVKVTNKNIVCQCPWCDYEKVTSKDHMWISTEIPIFHCFRASCESSGRIGKLIAKIHGADISSKFVDESRIKKTSVEKSLFKPHKIKDIKLPEIRTDIFPNKTLYTRKRLKFANVDIKSIKGLIFDVNGFIENNDIIVDENLFRIKEYLQTNFVGFLTENQSTVMLRNIDPTSNFKFFKMKVQPSKFLDYYKIPAGNKKSKQVVLSEGIFDIYAVKLFDILKINNEVKLYAAALSSKFASLIQSIVYHEQEFRLDVIFLSDRGIDPNYYKKIKRYNEHIINKCCIYYNKTGNDFNDTPVTLLKIAI